MQLHFGKNRGKGGRLWKKKRILIVEITGIVIAVIALIGMRLLGEDSNTRIDNNPEVEAKFFIQ